MTEWSTLGRILARYVKEGNDYRTLDTTLFPPFLPVFTLVTLIVIICFVTKVCIVIQLEQ